MLLSRKPISPGLLSEEVIAVLSYARELRRGFLFLIVKRGPDSKEGARPCRRFHGPKAAAAEESERFVSHIL
jgi:hypothetical protein